MHTYYRADCITFLLLNYSLQSVLLLILQYISDINTHYYFLVSAKTLSTIGQYPKQQFKMEKAETKDENVFKDFCESTSLHGYSYLFIGNSIFLKIIWTIVILLMTCVGAMFLMNNTIDYLNATLVTTTESTSAPLKVKI